MSRTLVRKSGQSKKTSTGGHLTRIDGGDRSTTSDRRHVTDVVPSGWRQVPIRLAAGVICTLAPAAHSVDERGATARLWISRRTVYYWIESGQLDLQPDEESVSEAERIIEAKEPRDNRPR